MGKKGLNNQILIIVILIIIAISCFVFWYIGITNLEKQILSYNSEYEIYLETKISGVDLTTVMNKAIDNNEQHSIEKDGNGLYKDDQTYYTEIYVNVKSSDEEDGNSENYAYPMESFDEIGITRFTNLYGSAYFTCVKTEYHKNGRISKMIFEITN